MAARAPGETESRRFLRTRLLPPRLRSSARCARGQTIPRTARPRRSGGSRGSCRRRARVGGPSGGGTTAAEPSRVRIEATQMRAGLLQFFLVADRAIAVDEAEQRVGRALGVGIVRNHVLEVDDRRVVRLPPQIEHAVLVGLLRELILEADDVEARARRGVAIGIPAGELLVDRQRGFARGRIELGPVPQPEIRVAGAEQRERRILGRGKLVRDLPEVGRRLRVLAELERALGEIVVDLRKLRLARPEFERQTLQQELRAPEIAMTKYPQRAFQLHVRLQLRRWGG